MGDPVNTFLPSCTETSGKLRAPLCLTGRQNFSPFFHYRCPAPPKFPFPETSFEESRGATGDAAVPQRVNLNSKKIHSKQGVVNRTDIFRKFVMVIQKYIQCLPLINNFTQCRTVFDR